MSEAEAEVDTSSDADRRGVPFVTRQPFELSEELETRVGELELQPRLDELRDDGYTIVPDIAPLAFTAAASSRSQPSTNRPHTAVTRSRVSGSSRSSS